MLHYEGSADLGAIQLTTAAGCVAMIEPFLADKLPGRGFLRREDASLSDVLATCAGSRLARKGLGPKPAAASGLSALDVA